MSGCFRVGWSDNCTKLASTWAKQSDLYCTFIVVVVANFWSFSKSPDNWELLVKWYHIGVKTSSCERSRGCKLNESGVVWINRCVVGVHCQDRRLLICLWVHVLLKTACSVGNPRDHIDIDHICSISDSKVSILCNYSHIFYCFEINVVVDSQLTSIRKLVEAGLSCLLFK